MRFVIITGMSGAGKTAVTHHLEDMGYYCVDNMPPMLLLPFAKICRKAEGQLEKVAVVIDTRGGDMFGEMVNELASLSEFDFPFEILFLDAQDDVLVSRFKQSRRPHPLNRGTLLNSIREERELLHEMRRTANHTLDTSVLNSHQLKESITSIFKKDEDGRVIFINIQSFGFKYGLPTDSDLVFDVRFIPNPFYVPSLKPLSGLDPLVSEYVMSWDVAKDFYKRLEDLIVYLLPLYMEEGKGQLIISIGCTGGKHRSVTIAQKLYEALKRLDYIVSIAHRDVEL